MSDEMVVLMRAKITTLREALRPFASLAASYDGYDERDWIVTERSARGVRGADTDFTVGDLRRAQAACSSEQT